MPLTNKDKIRKILSYVILKLLNSMINYVTLFHNVLKELYRKSVQHRNRERMRYLRGKAFNMVLLFRQSLLRNEEREVRVLNAHLLDLLVKEVLDRFPDGVRPWPQNVTP